MALEGNLLQLGSVTVEGLNQKNVLMLVVGNRAAEYHYVAFVQQMVLDIHEDYCLATARGVLLPASLS